MSKLETLKRYLGSALLSAVMPKTDLPPSEYDHRSGRFLPGPVPKLSDKQMMEARGPVRTLSPQDIKEQLARRNHRTLDI